MGEFVGFIAWFFQGRRRMGLVTLMMTMAFLGGWIRSPLNKDSVQFEFGTSFVTFASNQNGLWLVTSELPGSVYQPVILGGKSETFALPGHRYPFSSDPFGHLTRWFWVTEQRWDWYGFHYGRYCDERPIGGIRLTFRIIPHWAVILPFTLISAFLLLVKPRQLNQDQNTELIAVEGT
jgi:hypothetical protein